MNDIARGLDTTLNIVKAAGSILDHKATFVKFSGYSASFGKTMDKLNTTTSSIASYSAQTTIISRMYVEESLLDEIVLPNLTKSLHELYAAQIISALGLSRMVNSVQNVQEVMSLVQTGHTMREKSLVGIAAHHAGNYFASRRQGMESFMSAYTGEPSDGAMGLESHSHDDHLELVTKSQLDKLESERDDALLGAQEVRVGASRQKEAHIAELKTQQGNHDAEMLANRQKMTVSPVETSKHRMGPMGELYHVTLSNPSDKDGKGANITVPVFIQMQPYMIPTELAPRFVDMNVSPSLWQRWTQWKAGEISFFKDFLFQADLARKHQSALKNPAHAKAHAEFLRTIANKDKYAIDDVLDKSGRRQSSNLANSVVIFSESTLAQAKVDSGIDLHNEKDRERYFRQTYTMMIVVIDPLHQRVIVYFHGIDGDINVSYNEFRPKDKGFEPQGLMQALQAFSTNSVGRLR